jgi:hypothetical protein
MQLASLRKHWLLILLIVIGLAWWRIFDLLSPPRDPSLMDVDYWRIVTNPTLNWLGPVGFIAIIVLILIQIRRISKIIFRIALVGTILVSCGASTYSFLYDNRRSGTVEHMMTVQYQGKPYHLAYYKHYRPWDIVVEGYIVLECDALDRHCSMVNQDSGSRESSKVLVKDDKLFYEYADRSYQILPALNKSS